MSIISHLHPLNLEEEHERFIDSFTSNPQFIYTQIIDQSLLQQWGRPQQPISALAKSLIQKKGQLHTNRKAFEEKKVADLVRKTLSQIGVIEEIFITFDSKKVTRCSVTGTHIQFRSPPIFESEGELCATINHEVQTHLLRNVNQKKQGWTLDRAKHEKEILLTEEGLAVLHSLLALPEKIMWRPAAYHIAVEIGMRSGFRDMYNELMDMGFDDDFAWRLCIRVKRGLTDTSLPGGNTKDICYLEGAVQMWKWICNKKNNPRDLYAGKIFIEEVEEKLLMKKTDEYYIPTFFADIEKYKKMIDDIGKANGFMEVI